MKLGDLVYKITKWCHICPILIETIVTDLFYYM